MRRSVWSLTKATVNGFIEDEAMTRGAAIACYTLFSIAPLLFISIAIAGAFFGEDNVRGAVTDQLRALVGREGADAVQAMVTGTNSAASTGFAALVGAVILFVTASGVFAELQASLNVIWRAEVKEFAVSRLLRARALSVGLVGATGFLLLTSLVVSAGLEALATWIHASAPGLDLLLRGVNFLVSFLLVAALFAAIYKILPDRQLAWRDVGVGALVTSFLFSIGKAMIGWYIGGSGAAQSYGAAGALVVVLLWVYYSAQVFLLGAEFTRAWALQTDPRKVANVSPAARPEPAVPEPPTPPPAAPRLYDGTRAVGS